MDIPKAIAQRAAFYLKNVPGSEVVALGDYAGTQAFCVDYPDDAFVGFPPVFLLDGAKVREIIGEDALRIISLLSAS